MSKLTDSQIKLLKKNNISLGTYKKRIARGWAEERALHTACNPYSRLGTELIEQLKKAGISASLYRSRLKNGWTKEEASSFPPRQYLNVVVKGRVKHELEEPISFAPVKGTTDIVDGFAHKYSISRSNVVALLCLYVHSFEDFEAFLETRINVLKDSNLSNNTNAYEPP